MLAKRITPLHLMLAVVVFVLVPFLSWYLTWFGRPLTNDQIAEYLGDSKARKVQHALQKISERIQNNDPAVQQWYPRVCLLAASPVPEIRINVAWVLGQDNQAGDFHQALLTMIADGDPLVRRNAALSLVRFRDASGKPELLEMLRPYTVRAPRDGSVTFRLKVQDSVGRGTLLARVGDGEIRSPLPGRFDNMLVKEGSRVAAGDRLLELGPAADQVWESLRSLYLIGSAEDLPDVERFVRGSPEMPARIQQQAELTAQAIRRRG